MTLAEQRRSLSSEKIHKIAIILEVGFNSGNEYDKAKIGSKII